jgi:parallel beta-helix repeat protein
MFKFRASLFGNVSVVRFLSFAALLLGTVFNSHAAVINHSGTISSNSTWFATDTHVITGNVTVGSGVELTIEPGAVIKFAAGRSLNVSGVLDAQGTLGNEVIFTSIKDDSVGGDTNGDGAASTPAPGDWNYLRFSNSGSNLSQVDYAEFRYGGSTSGTVYTTSSNATLSNSVIRDSLNSGIYANYSSPTFSGNTVSDSGGSGIHVQYATHQFYECFRRHRRQRDQRERARRDQPDGHDPEPGCNPRSGRGLCF